MDRSDQLILLVLESVSTGDFIKGHFFHGTTKAFADFRKPQKYSPSMQHGFGIHFTSDHDWARKHYAGDSGTVRRVRLRARRVLDTDAIHHEGTPEYNFAKELYRGGRSKLVTHENPDGGPRQFMMSLDVTHPKRAESLLRKHGFDAVRYTAKQSKKGHYPLGVRPPSENAPSVIVLDPHQIEHAPY